jgi:CRISPR-associated protein Csy2
MKIDALLVVPKIEVQNVNIITSSLTWGFPSPTAFCGLTHGLQRFFEKEFKLEMNGVGIICNKFSPQVSNLDNYKDICFHLRKFPAKKDGGNAPIIQEGRANMTISLVIGLNGECLYDGTDLEDICKKISERIYNSSIAGGNITNYISTKNKPELYLIPGTEEELKKLNRTITRKLLPGFALVSRESMLEDHFQSMKENESSISKFDALLDITSLTIEQIKSKKEDVKENKNEKKDEGEKEILKTRVIKKSNGWLVPITSGYKSIYKTINSQSVKNGRDNSCDYQLVENTYTLGQWISPHRIKDITNILWEQNYHNDTEYYECTTKYYSENT